MADSRGGEAYREIAEFYRRQQWNIAIRLLSSLSNLYSSPILLCNRALCYSKLELYKHVIKDCNSALLLNSCTLQAYLYKGQAMVAMGKPEEACLVWQHGYEAGLGQPSDLQMVLQLYCLATQTNFATGKIDPRNVRTLQVEEAVTPASKNKIGANTGGVNQGEGSDRGKRQSSQAPPLNVDISLSRGIAQVNACNYEEAVQIFTQLITENFVSAGALVGRGTAYAFLRNLEAAINDFTKAIELDPMAVEAWKRRGQARAATGSRLEAIADFSKALEIAPKVPDTMYERGVVYYELKDFESAIEDLRSSLALDSTNRYAYNYYGSALAATGDYAEAMAAYTKAIELDPSLKEAWMHMAKLHKELGNSEKALSCLEQVLTMDSKCVHAYRLKGLLLFSLGDHRGAAQQLTTGLEMEPHNPDLHYLRGSCYHAIGNYAEAIKDYDEVLNADVISGESRTLQFLAFYQQETALDAVSKMNKPFKGGDIYSDLDPMFKEAWCKRLSPMVLFPAFNCQPLPEDLFSNGHLAPADVALTESRKVLLDTAGRVGHLIQYNCPGFLKNVRQHRMAGLAVLQIAQKVSALLQGSVVEEAEELTQTEREKHRGTVVEDVIQDLSDLCNSRDNVSLPCSPHERHHKRSRRLTWRDLYSIAVKWRQASEPCDPVVWIDTLSEKEYAAGFGSQTPLLLGQAKVVRYFPNFSRALVVAKSLILEQRHVYSAANKLLDLSDPMTLLAVDAVANCGEMYNVVGEDFWLVTPCQSTATKGKVLDGTRFTMQKTEINGYDFSIRTPCTSPRWADYDEELTAAWEEYCKLYCERSRSPDNPQVLKQLQDSILRLSFYWYNFMPLARGTAVVGYVMLLGLFLAADMEVTSFIPEGVQVDWEAILSQDLSMFTEAVWPWLSPSLKMDASWQDLPDVSENFPTFGSAVGALSSYY